MSVIIILKALDYLKVGSFNDSLFYCVYNYSV